MPADRPPRRWDLFCRVVDNLGDAAILWRLARQLANEHGLAPRLWIDDPGALAALRPGVADAPRGPIDGVVIERWTEADPRLAAAVPGEVADVVVGGFACALPAGYREAMRARRPVWVNLDYLSAEDWVAAHHGLPSPKPDGLVEHFFFPGFGDGTGGLLREADLIARRDAFGADPSAALAFLESLGVAPRAGDRFASLFCYPGSPVQALVEALATDPSPGRWRLLLPQGVAPDAPAHPSIVRVPFVPQRDYDRLLWCCELNFVRGEDSLVRGLWAGRPIVWQAYRQQDGAHLPKLEAFLARWLAYADPGPGAADAWRTVHRAWNASPDPAARPATAGALPALLRSLGPLRAAAGRWADARSRDPDLASRLVAFVCKRL
jgi:uncharacterized repeat protein (TIGR03837 family)